MPIEPIKKSNVSEEVFEQMKTLISTGEWKAGEKIQSENDLAKTFGVSRVPFELPWEGLTPWV